MNTPTATAVPGIRRRWLASVILAAADAADLPALPFQRGQRRRPASLTDALQSEAPDRPTALAAR